MQARKRNPGIRTTDPDPKKKSKGSKRAIIKRNKKGDLEATLPADFGGITTETLRADRITKAGTSDGTYDGAPASRVGGAKVEKKDGPVQGGTRPMIRKAKRRARNSSASKIAKRAAIRAY